MMRVLICSKVSRALSSTSVASAEVVSVVIGLVRLITVFPQESTKNYPTGRGAMVALLSVSRCRPVLTAVAGCHLSRKQCLPDPADTSSSIATAEVLAVDAARSG